MRWYEDPAVLVVAGGVALAAILERRTVGKVVDAVKDPLIRGPRLSYGTMDHRGVILTLPEDLRRMASERAGWNIPMDTYALAKMIRSEGSAAGLVRAHVALNDLASLGWSSLTTLLTYSTAPWAKGRFGRQFSAKYRAFDGTETWDVKKARKDANGRPVIIDKQVRRYATSQDPYDLDARTAQQAIDERADGIDRANGATKFLDRSSMGVQEGSSAFEVVDARWRADGLTPFTIAEYGDDLVFYKRVA